ncbi:MAG: exonuclease domain-containing protein [Ruminiclostridium sp.]|nr:exonuclease domain-containing protein [Ruminiclostridium sp.]
MNYIIFDLEWNQPSGMERSKDMPHGEIIQLGFIVTNDSLELLHREELTIKPEFYRHMNPYVSTLTGITQSDIDAGIGFAPAMERMSEFFGEATALITWGDDDMPILHENIDFHGLYDLDLPVHYNLQRIFAAQTNTDRRQIALKTAAETLGITDEIKAHDALNDAYMTYLIAQKLDIPAGIRAYTSEPSVKKKKVVQPWEAVLPLCTANFPEKIKPGTLSLSCKKVRMCCPKCGNIVTGGEKVRQGKNSYVSVSECSCGRRFLRYSLSGGILNAACFAMTNEFEKIYRSRLKVREKNLRHREAQRRAAAEKKKDD